MISKPAKDTHPPSERNADGAQAVHRSLAIMRALASQGPVGMQMADVARACSLHKGTAHRILQALEAEHMVERVPGSRKFRLGIDILALAASMSDRLDLKVLARPSLVRLAELTGDTVYLGMRSGYDGLCVDCVVSALPEKTLTLSIGDRWPLGVGSFSMALLAWLPDEEVHEILATNEKRLAGSAVYTPEMLHGKIREAREQLYAHHEVQMYPCMSGIGVPIMDENLRPIASLCAAAPIARMTTQRRLEIAKLAREEARRISAAYLAPPVHRSGMESWRKIGHDDSLSIYRSKPVQH